jgi:hypothetical protein
VREYAKRAVLADLGQVAYADVAVAGRVARLLDATSAGAIVRLRNAQMRRCFTIAR